MHTCYILMMISIVQAFPNRINKNPNTFPNSYFQQHCRLIYCIYIIYTSIFYMATLGFRGWKTTYNCSVYITLSNNVNIISDTYLVCQLESPEYGQAALSWPTGCVVGHHLESHRTRVRRYLGIKGVMKRNKFEI